MRARRRYRYERSHRELPYWVYDWWFRPSSEVEAIIWEAFRVRRNVVR